MSVELTTPAIGLLGANGAGKSTLMRALLGLVEPDAGSARLLGIDAAARGLELRRRIGYMPEHECLPSWMTARDLVVHLGELRGLPRRIAVLRTSEVLFQVGLEEERLRLIGTFSTGMRQRVKLAQALVHSPELVVLDEPTNGLDPQGRDEMLELVRRLSRDLGIRVLFSSHVLEDVERTCDAVVVLRDGRVAAQGRICDLLGREAGSARLSAFGDIAALHAALTARGLRRRGRRGGLADGARRAWRAARRRARRLRRGGREPARAAAGRPHARGRRDRGDRMSARLEDTRYARYEGVRRAPWLAVVSLARWSAFGALGARKSWRAKFLPVTLTLIALAAGLRRARDPRDRRAALPEPLPRAHPVPPVPDRDRARRDDLRGHPLPRAALSRQARQRALAVPLDGGRAPHLRGRQAASRRSCRCSALTLAAGAGAVRRQHVLRRSATGYLGDHWADIFRIVASGLLLASYVSLVGLAVASFTSRRAFALGAYAALMLIPTFVGSALVDGAELDRHVQLIMLGRLPIAAARRSRRRPGLGARARGLVVVAACGVVMAISAGCLWWRYRRADA